MIVWMIDPFDVFRISSIFSRGFLRMFSSNFSFSILLSISCDSVTGMLFVL